MASVFILINNSVTTDIRSSTNGIAHTFNALARTIGPIIGKKKFLRFKNFKKKK